MDGYPQRVATGVPRVQSPVTVFWRPGCPYCIRLNSKLRRAGIRAEEINIWEDPEGAAFVRSATGGDETVPTVRMWDKVMVNPSPRLIIHEIRRRAPELVSTEPVPRGSSRRLQLLQWVVLGLLIGSSLVAEGLGHSSLSWLIDAVAIASYLVIRGLRRRVGLRDRVPGGTSG